MRIEKIVFLTRPIAPPWDEASKNFALYLVKQLRIPSMQFILLTTKEYLKGLPPSVRQEGIHTTKALTLQSKLKLLWYLWKTDARFVHCLFVLTPLTGLVLRLLKGVKGFKIIQTISSLSEHRFLLPFTIFGDEVVCFSNKTAQILKTYGISATIIPPAIPLHLFKPVKKENIIAFLGELHRLESFDLVSHLIEKFVKEFPDYSIVLGFRTTRKPKEELELVSRLKKKWQLNDRISFMDVIEDMPAFLAKTKLVMLPATRVTEKFDFPLVLLEALGSGTPIIVSNVGPLQELAGLPGVASPTTNTPEALCAAAQKIFNNFEKFSKAARTTAENHFNIDHVAKQYETLYKKTFI